MTGLPGLRERHHGDDGGRRVESDRFKEIGGVEEDRLDISLIQSCGGLCLSPVLDRVEANRYFESSRTFVGRRLGLLRRSKVNDGGDLSPRVFSSTDGLIFGHSVQLPAQQD